MSFLIHIRIFYRVYTLSKPYKGNLRTAFREHWSCHRVNGLVIYKISRDKRKACVISKKCIYNVYIFFVESLMKNLFEYYYHERIGHISYIVSRSYKLAFFVVKTVTWSNGKMRVLVSVQKYYFLFQHITWWTRTGSPFR